MAQIQSTSSFLTSLPGTADTLQISVNAFPLFAEVITVFWQLKGNGVSVDGTMVLPSAVVAEWGTDDSVVLNYVAGQLGVILVEES